MKNSSDTGSGSRTPVPASSQETLWRLVRRSLLNPVTLAFTLLSIPLSVWGVFRTASDANDTGLLTSFLLTATAILPTAWAVIRVIWSESANVAIVVALVRTVLVPLVVAWPPAIAVAITLHVPSVQARIAATQEADGWRYFFGSRDGSLMQQALVLGGLAGIIFSMLTAIALSVFVVLPALAWFKPVGTAKSNMLRTETAEDRVAATVGIRMLSIVLMMTFAVPTLIIFGSEEAVARSVLEAFTNLPRFFVEPQYYYGDLMWVVGILAVPVGVFILFRLRRVQRPDVAARARFGVNSVEDRQRFTREPPGSDDASAPSL